METNVLTYTVTLAINLLLRIVALRYKQYMGRGEQNIKQNVDH
jgi:hypothetical protein